MSILNQKTIKDSITFEGFGLHSGKKASMTIMPAEVNRGIVFKRIDLKKNNLIIPNIFNVSEANFCTTISNEFDVKVSTIEHLMAALYCLGVDNAIIEIDTQEVPIMDGSSRSFIEKIYSTGLKTLNSPIKIIKIEKKVELVDGLKTISIDKSNVSLEIDFEIKFENPVIGSQRNKINVYEDELNDIFNSRTFCLYEDIEKLKKMGLAKGGSLKNAIVVKGNQVLNEEGLRNKLEFVNHKILDCLGDLYLSGYKVIGSIVCSQGGHKLTNQLLRKLFSDKSNYSIFEIKEKYIPHTLVNKSHLKSIA